VCCKLLAVLVLLHIHSIQIDSSGRHSQPCALPVVAYCNTLFNICLFLRFLACVRASAFGRYCASTARTGTGPTARCSPFFKQQTPTKPPTDLEVRHETVYLCRMGVVWCNICSEVVLGWAMFWTWWSLVHNCVELQLQLECVGVCNAVAISGQSCCGPP
jgi:hypothetical protein